MVIMKGLHENRQVPAVPENEMFMQFLGLSKPIDENIRSAMPCTQWQNNGAAFAEELKDKEEEESD